MKEQGNIIKQRAIHKSNFTIMHNEILFRKNEEGKPVSLEALGLFWRIMSLPKKWKLCQIGLESIVGNKSGRVGKLLKELESFGYIKVRQKRKKGQTDGYEYFITETIDPTLWNTENSEIINIENEQLDVSPYPEFPDMEKPDMESPDMEILAQYKHVNNKKNKIIKNDNNILRSDLKVTSDCIASQSLNEPLNEPLNLTSLDKNNLNLINMEVAKGCEKGCENKDDISKLPNYKQKQIERQKIRDKKNEALRQYEENKPKQSIKNLIDKTLSEQTEAERLEANCRKMINEAKEERQIAEFKSQKRTSFIKRVQSYVDKDVQNQELAVKLKDYFTSCIESGMKITKETYKAQMDNLFKLSRDPKEQLNIIQQSIQKGWKDFYPLQTSYKSFKKSNEKFDSKINQEKPKELSKLATDENGNIIYF